MAMVPSILLVCALPTAGAFGGYAWAGRGVYDQLRSVNRTKMRAEEDATGQRDSADASDRHRRALLVGTIALPSAWAIRAGPSRAAKLRPDDAYASLVKARRELQVADETYLPKRDWDGLRNFLRDEAVNMNDYEVSAQALLESKRLDAESKKDIGTIRRYGVGADVMIMYGGLKSEIDEDNEGTREEKVGSYLLRTEQSLDEVLAICRSNGFP